MPTEPGQAAEIRLRLQQCARLLQDTAHLDPETRKAMAHLVLELSEALDPEADSEHAAQLAESSAHLIETLRTQQDSGLITSARERLEQAAARAETEAPVATGVARQLIDALSGIGI